MKTELSGISRSGQYATVPRGHNHATGINQVTRIVIAGEDTRFRERVRSIIAAEDGREVVAVVGSIWALVEAVQIHHADLVVMDIHLPSGGVAMAKLLTKLPVDCRCIAISREVNPSLFRSMLVAGAAGCLLEESIESELGPAVNLVVHDGVAVSRAISDALLLQPVACPIRLFPELTTRESDVLGVLATGASNAEIAEALFLSSKTVANHVSIILDKLQEPDRAALIRRARGFGSGWAGANTAP